MSMLFRLMSQVKKISDKSMRNGDYRDRIISTREIVVQHGVKTPFQHSFPNSLLGKDTPVKITG